MVLASISSKRYCFVEFNRNYLSQGFIKYQEKTRDSFVFLDLTSINLDKLKDWKRILFDDVKIVAIEECLISNMQCVGFELIGDFACKTIAGNQKLLDWVEESFKEIGTYSLRSVTDKLEILCWNTDFLMTLEMPYQCVLPINLSSWVSWLLRSIPLSFSSFQLQVGVLTFDHRGRARVKFAKAEFPKALICNSWQV